MTPEHKELGYFLVFFVFGPGLIAAVWLFCFPYGFFGQHADEDKTPQEDKDMYTPKYKVGDRYRSHQANTVYTVIEVGTENNGIRDYIQCRMQADWGQCDLTDYELDHRFTKVQGLNPPSSYDNPPKYKVGDRLRYHDGVYPIVKIEPNRWGALEYHFDVPFPEPVETVDKSTEYWLCKRETQEQEASDGHDPVKSWVDRHEVFLDKTQEDKAMETKYKVGDKLRNRANSCVYEIVGTCDSGQYQEYIAEDSSGCTKYFFTYEVDREGIFELYTETSEQEDKETWEPKYKAKDKVRNTTTGNVHEILNIGHSRGFPCYQLVNRDSTEGYPYWWISVERLDNSESYGLYTETEDKPQEGKEMWKPKYKVGDKVRRTDRDCVYTIAKVENQSYLVYLEASEHPYPFANTWVENPDKFTLYTETNETTQENNDMTKSNVLATYADTPVATVTLVYGVPAQDCTADQILTAIQRHKDTVEKQLQLPEGMTSKYVDQRNAENDKSLQALLTVLDEQHAKPETTQNTQNTQETENA